MEIPKPKIFVPLSISHLIGDMTQVQDIAANFFSGIHTWLPIISKIRFKQSLLNPLAESRPDVALLLLCMQLITWSPSDREVLKDPQTSAYHTTKRFAIEVETSGVLSLQALQGLILLALFEFGHAIYPAAYLSIGSCARYGSALGINGKATATTFVGQKYSWLEQEERKRIWWAIIILDRLVYNSSSRHKDVLITMIVW